MGLALITGASAGLGREFATLFARDGHDLLLVARRLEKLEEVQAELQEKYKIKVIIKDLDLSKLGAAETLYKFTQEHGLRVEFLVNNAGFGSQGAFSGLALERELQMIDLNVRSLVALTHLYLKDMLNSQGRILNVGSTAGFQPGPFMATYYATKAFVNSFSEALSQELKDTTVTCTLLTPGATETEFFEAAGMKNSKLLKHALVAKSREVAEVGYKAMLRGQVLAMPGLHNQLLLQSLRVAPRSLVRKLAAQLNRG